MLLGPLRSPRRKRPKASEPGGAGPALQSLTSMRVHALLRAFFIIYCMEAGFFLLFGPWSTGWDRTALLLPSATLRSVYLHPLLRSAVSGFGLVHLVWSMHDLIDFFARRWRVDSNA